jgi:hypothetical protein
MAFKLGAGTGSAFLTCELPQALLCVSPSGSEAEMLHTTREGQPPTHFFSKSKTADVMVFIPVRNVGSGTGAKNGE